MKFTNLILGLLLSSSAWAQYQLIFEDNFDSTSLNTNYWTPVDYKPWAWRNTAINDPRVLEVSNGTLKLNGIKNPNFSGNLSTVQSIDSSTVWTGAVESRYKIDFKYGKVEVRARVESAPRAWPAIWLLPTHNVYGVSPNSGEIDILEHLNFDTFFYSTVHTQYHATYTSDPQRSAKESFNLDKNEWNVYAIEWDSTKIDFIKNGNVYHTFYKGNEGTVNGLLRWPFDEEFYIILSQQIGGGWVDNEAKNKGLTLTDNDLPITMEIDYVKVYQKKNPTSTTKLQNSTVKVFPNPTTGILNIQHNSPKNLGYTITSSTGKQVAQAILNGNNINVTHLPTGIYYLKLSDGRHTKFIKTK